MEFLRVFYAPKDVKYTGKKWILFFIVAFIVVFITLILNVHFNYDGIMKTITERLSSMPEEQKAQVMKMLSKKRMLIQGSLSLIVTLPLKLLLIAGILYFVRMIMGKENFAIPLFAAGVYTYIQAVGDFVKFLLSVIFRTFPFLTDPSILVSKKGFVSGFLSVFDVFTVYAMYVAALIVSEEEKDRKMHYFIILIGLLVLWGVIKGFMIKVGVK